jgi:hypothetical protein
MPDVGSSNQARIPNQRQREREPLLLPAGESTEVGVDVRLQANLFDQLRAVARIGIVGGEHRHGLAYFDLLVDCGLLKHETDLLLQRASLFDRVESQNPNRARICFPISLQRLDGRGLAGSVWAQQGEDFRAPNPETQAVDSLDLTVMLDQAVDRDGLIAHCRSAGSNRGRRRNPVGHSLHVTIMTAKSRPGEPEHPLKTGVILMATAVARPESTDIR